MLIITPDKISTRKTSRLKNSANRIITITFMTRSFTQKLISFNVLCRNMAESHTIHLLETSVDDNPVQQTKTNYQKD